MYFPLEREDTRIGLWVSRYISYIRSVFLLRLRSPWRMVIDSIIQGILPPTTVNTGFDSVIVMDIADEVTVPKRANYINNRHVFRQLKQQNGVNKCSRRIKSQIPLGRGIYIQRLSQHLRSIQKLAFSSHELHANDSLDKLWRSAQTHSLTGR